MNDKNNLHYQRILRPDAGHGRVLGVREVSRNFDWLGPKSKLDFHGKGLAYVCRTGSRSYQVEFLRRYASVSFGEGRMINIKIIFVMK